MSLPQRNLLRSHQVPWHALSTHQLRVCTFQLHCVWLRHEYLSSPQMCRFHGVNHLGKKGGAFQCHSPYRLYTYGARVDSQNWRCEDHIYLFYYSFFIILGRKGALKNIYWTNEWMARPYSLSAPLQWYLATTFSNLKILWWTMNWF